MVRNQEIASQLRRSIEQGVLRPGERLPSTREASRARRTTMATVQRAYELLEFEGLIEARTRSGWYVHAREVRHVPFHVERELDPGNGDDICDLTLDVAEDTNRAELVALGSEAPGTELFPWNDFTRAAARAGRRFSSGTVFSAQPPGNPELRRMIALHYLQAGAEISPQEILITSGTTESLTLALTALASPGECVVIESPTFPAVFRALRGTRLRSVAVPMLEKGFPNLDAFDRMLRCETVKACLLMTSCRNPVGTTMPDSVKQALVALLQRRGVPLIEEDSNGELWFSSRAPRPAKAFDQVGHVLHMGTFANSLEPGGGVGWVAAGRYCARLVELQASSSGPTSALNQAAVAEYLKGGRYDAHLRRLRRALSERCRQLLEALHKALPAGSCFQAPDGGCVTWVQLPRSIDGRELRRRARREGVGLAPGAMFSTHPACKNFVRVGFGDAWSEQREGAVRTLGRLVAERNETGC